VDERELKAACEAYGVVSSVQVIKSPMGHCKGFAFVEFARSQHANA
jgi:RNA recognition motif-containing protein